MVSILSHIGHVIEAPCLDAFNPEGEREVLVDKTEVVRGVVPIKYYAHLIDEETGQKTRDVECMHTRIDEDGPDTNENTLVYFQFDPHDLLSFEDRAKLSLYIYTENYVQAWWKKKAYRFIKTKITCENE